MVDLSRLPDPNSPLNEMEKRVFGIDTIRHPITGYPLERGGHATSSDPAGTPERQARRHLEHIRREHGDAVAQEIERRLKEFEATGAPPLRFHHAQRLFDSNNGD